VALYVAQGYAETGVAPYGSQLGGRYALFGLAGHAMFTGIFGASLGLAIQTRRSVGINFQTQPVRPTWEVKVQEDFAWAHRAARLPPPAPRGSPAVPTLRVMRYAPTSRGWSGLSAASALAAAHAH
jgi:hypothetical protein